MASLPRLQSVYAVASTPCGYIDKLDEADRHRVTKEAAEKRMRELNAASNGVDRIREAGKALANAARHARTNIVGRVFNTALNKVWRDLFVRLAPQEKFVPAFKLASSSDEPVEAGLETVHRSGEKGGPPGTMLSAGKFEYRGIDAFSCSPSVSQEPSAMDYFGRSGTVNG
jgi:DNA repair protein SbcC/Rad50